MNVYTTPLSAPGNTTCGQAAPEHDTYKPIDEYGRNLALKYGTGPRIPVDERASSLKPRGESKAQRRMRRRHAQR